MTNSSPPKPQRPHLRLVPNPSAGEAAQCERCGVRVRVAPTRNANARMLRHAPTGSGFCVDCSTAQWFSEMGYRDGLMVGVTLDPASLLLPQVQESFARIMAVSGADATRGEIDWPKVVRDWDLPFPKAARRPKKSPRPA